MFFFPFFFSASWIESSYYGDTKTTGLKLLFHHSVSQEAAESDIYKQGKFNK